jgi:hypothetical protein
MFKNLGSLVASILLYDLTLLKRKPTIERYMQT